MGTKKILFVIHGVNYGGACKMIVFVANAMAQKGFEVVLYSYDSLICRYPLNEEVTFLATKINSKNKFIKAGCSIKNIRNKINEVKPDVVISFLSDANAYSVIASKFIKKKSPVIICERTDPYNDNASFSKIMQFFFKKAQGAVFQTEGAQKYFGKRLAEKSTIIPNPVIDTNISEKAYESRKDEIVFPARFTNIQKRQDVMVKAFKIVHDKYPNMKLVFIGDGPDQEKILNMVDELKLSDSVEFLGVIDNVIDKIRESKIFAITSDYEGIPNSLIEAMSIGMPVVSTDMSPGGAKLLIENGKNGLLVPVEDYNAVAESIIYYIENPIRAIEMGIEAKKVLERFSEEKVIDMWNSYICKVLELNN